MLTTTYDDTCLRCGQRIRWVELSERAARIRRRNRVWLSALGGGTNMQTEICRIGTAADRDLRDRHVPIGDSDEVMAWLTE